MGNNKVCRIPLPIMHSHDENMELWRRKVFVKFREKQNSADLCVFMSRVIVPLWVKICDKLYVLISRKPQIGYELLPGLRLNARLTYQN